jgi:hypothetical protein
MRNPLKNSLAARAPSRRVLNRPALALVAAFALALAAPAYAHHAARVARQDTPEATVRDFLGGVVDADGNSACQYLTARARVSFEGHSPSNPTCEQFFAGASLTLGGLDVQSKRDVNQLSYRVVPIGSARRVVVSHGGQSISFVLRLGSPPELQEFRAPPTPWRIDSSVAALGTPQSASPAEV